MDQLGPLIIKHPQHAGARPTKRPFGVHAALLRRASRRDGLVFTDLLRPGFDVERRRDGAQIHAARVPAHFAADAACAELVGHRRVRVDRVRHGAALAAAVERSERREGGRGRRDGSVRFINGRYASKMCGLQELTEAWFS